MKELQCDTWQQKINSIEWGDLTMVEIGHVITDVLGFKRAASLRQQQQLCWLVALTLTAFNIGISVTYPGPTPLATGCGLLWTAVVLVLTRALYERAIVGYRQAQTALAVQIDGLTALYPRRRLADK